MGPDPARSSPRPSWGARELPATPEAALRSARVIGIALISGCLVFAGMALFLRSRGTATSVGESVRSTFTWIGWAAAGANFVLSFVLRGRPPEEPGRRASHLLSRTTVALGLNEASVLLNLSFVLVTGSAVPGLYAAGIGFAGLVLHFPTAARFGLAP